MLHKDELEQIETFCHGVEALAQAGNSYIDSVVQYCQQHEIEFDNAPKLLSPKLLSRLQTEAEKQNLIKKSTIGKLPIDAFRCLQTASSD